MAQQSMVNGLSPALSGSEVSAVAYAWSNAPLAALRDLPQLF
jgi:hypothetical protein